MLAPLIESHASRVDLIFYPAHQSHSIGEEHAISVTPQEPVSLLRHQGVVGWVQSYPFRNKPFESDKQKFILLLDSIQDSRNLGAILRSAYCTGVDGVIITSKNSAPLNATAIKSSAGLAEHLEIQQQATALHAIQELKNAGYSCYLAMLDGTDATQVSYNLPGCLVIGNEAVGISKNISSLGTKITLPQKSADISYNASVAAGILLFMISSQNQLLAK